MKADFMEKYLGLVDVNLLVQVVALEIVWHQHITWHLLVLIRIYEWVSRWHFHVKSLQLNGFCIILLT